METIQSVYQSIGYLAGIIQKKLTAFILLF